MYCIVTDNMVSASMSKEDAERFLTELGRGRMVLAEEGLRIKRERLRA